MFIGHYGIAFAAKKAAPEASLGALVLAAQFADVLWPILVLAGIEQVRISPGITRATPLDFVFYPYSHGLFTDVIWGLIFAGIYILLRRSKRGAWVLGSLVVSHWILDVIVHRPDMPLAPGFPTKVGLGLWNSYGATIIVEIGLFALGVFVYLRSTRAKDRIGSIGLYTFVLFLFIGWLAAIFGPPPPGVKQLALGGLAIWITIGSAAWVDAHRELQNKASGA